MRKVVLTEGVPKFYLEVWCFGGKYIHMIPTEGQWGGFDGFMHFYTCATPPPISCCLLLTPPMQVIHCGRLACAEKAYSSARHFCKEITWLTATLQRIVVVPSNTPILSSWPISRLSFALKLDEVSLRKACRGVLYVLEGYGAHIFPVNRTKMVAMGRRK